MARESGEIATELLDKFKAGDLDVFEYYDPEIEWDASRMGDFVPELTKVYRGHDGVRAYWRTWLAAWQPIEVWDYEIRSSGDRVVALISGQRNRGRHSGIELAIPPYALLFEFRGGKVVRWIFYPDQGEALAAVGLSE